MTDREECCEVPRGFQGGGLILVLTMQKKCEMALPLALWTYLEY